jgi:DNA-directed RNA polymerase specialized sigma24 family protein
VGASSKQLATILRLRRAIQASRQGESLTRLSIDAGYFDQPHFVREFRSYTLERLRASSQAFFLRALEKSFFTGFDPAKARFRTYLRTCLDGFVSNARKAEARLKRGGHLTMVPLAFDEAEQELRKIAVHPDEDFEALFQREWLRGLFAIAASRLRESCAACKRATRYALFERYDLADEERPPTYAELAHELGVSTSAVTNELAAARRDFRRFVLETLREQCATDEEFEAEARALGYEDL